MRIELIRAPAFGPFKGKELRLSPGLTVIHGLNEAGKSSWHAAIYAGLCGMRRGKGSKGADQEFTRRHHPWTGDDWRVDLILKLENGRRVELQQNLADLTDCHASDADLGSDISGEILNENTPDATLWLGLDRDTFSAVACVRQAEILDLADEDVADGLQEQLQKAAASAAREGTAAQALQRIEEFQKEYVGREQVNSTKPLQRAKNRHAQAVLARDSAVRAHREWLSLEVKARELTAVAESHATRHRHLLALRARRDAQVWTAKLQRAQLISAKYPDGPPVLTDQVSIAEEVSTALEQWSHRLEPPTLQGESAETIRAKITALPREPIGDLEPAAELVELKAEFDRARDAIRLHERQRPSEPEVFPTTLPPAEIRHVASEIELQVPSVDTSLQSAYQRAVTKSKSAKKSVRSIHVGGAIAALLFSVGLWVIGYRVEGAGLGVIVLVVLALIVFNRRAEPQTTKEVLAAIESQLEAQRSAAHAAETRKQSARARALAEGLPGSAKEIKALADAIVVAEERRQQLTGWDARKQSLESAFQDVQRRLLTALSDRGVAEVNCPEQAFERYVQACRTRARQAAAAASRTGLEEQLRAREAAELAVIEAERRNTAAADRVLTLDHRLGGKATSTDDASNNLRTWRQQYALRLAEYEKESKEYAELTAILGGDSIEVLKDRVEQARQRAMGFADHAPATPRNDLEVDSELDLDTAEQQAADATKAATEATTEASIEAARLPSVVEAEEEVERAALELDRVRRLQSTLAEALKFLRLAEEKVNRDLAPVLASGLRAWLPAVTQNRYTDARVDPGDLAIKLKDADQSWRDLWNLSYGTIEQVYLLLRVVLAERLVTTNETCPLILDDVLVHCDRVRKLAILETLKVVSTKQQVILFTQEDEVLRWAEGLPDGQLIRLADPLVPNE